MTYESEEGRPIQESNGPQAANVGNAEAVAKRLAYLNERQRQSHNDWVTVLSTDSGRRICMHVLGLTRVYHALSADSVASNREEGARNIGLQLIDLFNAVDPRAYAKMQLEAIDQHEMDQAILAQIQHRQLAD